MSETIRVKIFRPDRMFWERHESHPGGEAVVTGTDEFEVAETHLVRRAVHTGTLIKVDEVPAEAAELVLTSQPPELTGEPGPEDTAEVTDQEPSVIAATPGARDLAEEHGVNLAQITGSGADGKVIKKDVEAYIGNSE